jgi:four helix bundle protein
MLRIYEVALGLIRDMGPLLEMIGRKDPDLARQCRRALSSITLNISEGSYSQGRNRNARYHNAMGSAREALACFETTEALGYVASVESARAGFDHIIGTLFKVTR